MGQTNVARQQLLRAFELYPDSTGTIVWLGIAEHLAGRDDEAIRLFREALRINPQFSWALGNLGFLYGKLNRAEEAQAVIQDLRPLAKQRLIAWDLAGTYTGLKDYDTAFTQLEAADRYSAVELIWLNVDYRFRDLHGDPRFTSLLQRLHLQ